MKKFIVPFIVWASAIFVVQSATMYLLLRVLECGFFVSAVVASFLAAGCAHFTRRFAQRTSVA